MTNVVVTWLEDSTSSCQLEAQEIQALAHHDFLFLRAMQLSTHDRYNLCPPERRALPPTGLLPCIWNIKDPTAAAVGYVNDQRPW